MNLGSVQTRQEVFDIQEETFKLVNLVFFLARSSVQFVEAQLEAREKKLSRSNLRGITLNTIFLKFSVNFDKKITYKNVTFKKNIMPKKLIYVKIDKKNFFAKRLKFVISKLHCNIKCQHSYKYWKMQNTFNAKYYYEKKQYRNIQIDVFFLASFERTCLKRKKSKGSFCLVNNYFLYLIYKK